MKRKRLHAHPQHTEKKIKNMCPEVPSVLRDNKAGDSMIKWVAWMVKSRTCHMDYIYPLK